MRVVEATRFGGPGVLRVGDAPDPAAGPGQVIIDVAVADVLFLDTEIRSGQARAWFPIEPPYVPGSGVAGRVLAVGPDVDPGWSGRRVIAHTGEPGGYGAYAERAAVRAERLIRVPDGLDLRTAGALVHDGLTAAGLVEAAGLARAAGLTADQEPGAARAADLDEVRSVLVTAAAGGMGNLLVQLAHAAGARVVAAARGKRKLDLALKLGADTALDYTERRWPELVREATGGRGADVVFDGVGGEVGLAAFEATADGGVFSAHGAAAGGFAPIEPASAERRGIRLRGITDVQYSTAERIRLAGRALAAAAAGRIRPVIGQTFPLEKAAEAHAAVESRTVIGKTLLLTGDRPEGG